MYVLYGYEYTVRLTNTVNLGPTSIENDQCKFYIIHDLYGSLRLLEILSKSQFNSIQLFLYYYE